MSTSSNADLSARLQNALQTDPKLAQYFQLIAQSPLLQRQMSSYGQSDPAHAAAAIGVSPQNIQLLNDLQSSGKVIGRDGQIQDAQGVPWWGYLAMGAIAAPFLVAAAPALVGAGAGGGTAAAGTEGTLASSTVGTGLATLPTTATSGLVSGGLTTAGTAGTVGGLATAGTVAGTAGGASPVLGSTSLWTTLLGQGSNILGSYLQSNAVNNATAANVAAANHAADLQAQSNADTLNFEKQVYADRQQGLAPYRGIGTSAVNQLANLYGLGTSAPASASAAPMPTPSAPPPITNVGGVGGNAVGSPSVPTSTGGNLSQLSTPPSSAPMVTVQAPNGETRQMSSDLAQHYLSLNKGYVTVSQGAA